MQASGSWDEYEQVKSSYFALFENVSLAGTDQGIEEYISRKNMVAELPITASLKSADEFSSNTFLQYEITDLLARRYQIRSKLSDLGGAFSQLKIVSKKRCQVRGRYRF